MERFIGVLIEHFAGAFRFGSPRAGGRAVDQREVQRLCGKIRQTLLDATLRAEAN